MLDVRNGSQHPSVQMNFLGVDAVTEKKGCHMLIFNYGIPFFLYLFGDTVKKRELISVNCSVSRNSCTRNMKNN